MTGDETPGTASLSRTRAHAAAAARRYGVPRMMIENAALRRARGDWRGACAAADVEVCLNPGSLRGRHGGAPVARLLADLRTLAPDLLRWHYPRRGHGLGLLRGGILVPLADYPGRGTDLTLAATTPPAALAAGQRILLTVLESDVPNDALHGVHQNTAQRYDLRNLRMFWDAAHAPALAGFLDGVADGASTNLLSTLSARLPSLVRRVRTALPGVDVAAIRAGGAGTILLRGLEGSPRSTGNVTAEAVTAKDVRGLPLVPEAAWAEPVDAELLRLGLLRPDELHPLVASALEGIATADAASQDDDLVYRSVPGFAGTCPDRPGAAAVIVRCDTTTHRVARIDGRWQPVDHDDMPMRERLLAGLGGQANPCRQAARHLNDGRHVVDAVAPLLAHGRADHAVRLLREHADATAAPEDFRLPDGGTVGQALDVLRENTLQLQLILAGARPLMWSATAHREVPARRRSRKGEPARHHR